MVDGFAGRIHAAYFDEVVAIAQERSLSVQSLLTQLVTDEYPSVTFIARAGQALSIREVDGVWVAAALAAEGIPLQHFAERLRRRGRLAYTYTMGECIVAMWVARAVGAELVGMLDGCMSSPDYAELQSSGVESRRCTSESHGCVSPPKSPARSRCLCLPSTSDRQPSRTCGL